MDVSVSERRLIIWGTCKGRLGGPGKKRIGGTTGVAHWTLHKKNNSKNPSKQSLVRELYKHIPKTDMSHHIQVDRSKMLTLLDDMDSENGVCAHCTEETTCENTGLSSFMTIFNRKKAPAAAIKNREKRGHIDFLLFVTKRHRQ